MAAEAGRSQRRTYLDLLRGIAVLLMIDAHLFDSWTRFPDRDSRVFAMLMILGGMGTTLFLVLAGVAVALSAGSKARRTSDERAASQAVVRRGLEIFALAFVFRVQAWFLGWSHNPSDLLKVDVLNVMGPSIVFAALLWRSGRTVSARITIFAVGAAVVAFSTPVIRNVPLAFLPDPIEAYFVPVGQLSTFVFFPWAALVFAGAAMGVALDWSRTAQQEARANRLLGGCGAALLAVAVGSSYLPSLFSGSYFWTTSPSFLFIRVALVALGIAACYRWQQSSTSGWNPLVQLGRTSLFIYWIHVEMVYGLISLPLQRALSLPAAAAAYVAFCGLMLACSIAKDAAVDRFRTRQAVAAEVVTAGPAQRP